MAEQKKPQTSATPSFEEQLKALQAKLEAAEKAKEEALAAKEKAEEDAVESVCKALGVSPADIKAEEERKSQAADMMEYDLGPMVVMINGNEYKGQGVATRAVVEMLMHMAGEKRMREIRARVGNNSEVIQMAGGTIRSRLVSQVEG